MKNTNIYHDHEHRLIFENGTPEGGMFKGAQKIMEAGMNVGKDFADAGMNKGREIVKKVGITEEVIGGTQAALLQMINGLNKNGWTGILKEKAQRQLQNQMATLKGESLERLKPLITSMSESPDGLKILQKILNSYANTDPELKKRLARADLAIRAMNGEKAASDTLKSELSYVKQGYLMVNNEIVFKAGVAVEYKDALQKTVNTYPCFTLRSLHLVLLGGKQDPFLVRGNEK